MATKEFLERGSVVLIRYPFTDLTGSKLRPAIIVTPNDLIAALDDVLCAFVTTRIPENFADGFNSEYERSRLRCYGPKTIFDDSST
jgi:mRNA-degrading endonuclease toxin of MazEF toxin-antitoxin module